MIKNTFGLAIAAAAIALPGVAQAAGTSTDTSTASFAVVSQCALTAANVNLGVFTLNQTWDEVAAVHGKYNGTAYTAGTAGAQSINFGTVNCDTGLEYSLTIVGSSTTAEKGAVLTHGGKTMVLWPTIKKIGATTVADNAGWAGVGADASSKAVTGVGTGANQTILGALTLQMVTGKSTALGTDKLATAGVVQDTLNYSLTF